MSAAMSATYRCVITAVVLLIIYSVCDALRVGEGNPTAWVFLVLVGTLALALAVAVWSRHIVATYVQICAVPILAAVYLFELGQQDPVDQMLHREQFWRIVKSRVAAGQPVTIQYSPSKFAREPNGGITLPSGQRIFPLAQVANLPTIMCREGARPFAEYEADEYGFNNPKGIWGRPVDLMFIGDSMTYGACLTNRDHFIAQIRERYPATLNLGAGGIGPLIELAVVREFVPKIRPKYVFFMYDENNDLYFVRQDGDSDLAWEYRNPVLRKYVEDDRFSQGIYEHHSEINAAIKRLVDEVIASALAKRTPVRSLLGLLGLPLTRASLPPVKLELLGLWSRAATTSRPLSIAQPTVANEHAAPVPGLDHLEVFRRIFSKAVRVAKDAGARFVFVNIPAQGTLCDGIEHPWKRQVLDSVLKGGVDFIDLEQDFRNADRAIGRNALFAVPPCGGHFSEIGYRIIGDRLVQYLETREGLARGWSSDALSGIVKEGWTFGALPSDPGRSASSRARVVWSETYVYEPYARVSAILGAGPDGRARGGGAAILGNSYRRHVGGNGLRITVMFTAHSAEDNEIAVALFLGGEGKSSRLVVEPVKAGKSSSALLTYEIEKISDTVVDMQVFVGPRRPGTLYINGDGRGPVASDVKSSLTIEEVWRPARPVRSVRPDQLVYVGTDLDDRALAGARRAEVERRRRTVHDTPHIFAKALSGVKRRVADRVAATRVGHFEQQYRSHVRIDRVIDQASVVDGEGAAIMFHSFRPKADGARVRVRVAVPAWAEDPNSVVAALFVNESLEANKVGSQRLSPGQVSTATVELEYEAQGSGTINLVVRVGTGKRGTIYLNGDKKGPVPNMPSPTLIVDESWWVWPW